jgi:FemAB-related protein (PEP-CTERM system-associated)
MSVEPLAFSSDTEVRRAPAPALLPVPTPARSLVAVETLRAHREGEWDRYVRGSAGATFFHQLGWRWLVERVFGHRAHYLTALREGNIVGVLPLFELRSALFGHSLVSIPFAIGGGIAADDAAAATALLDSARAIATERRVDYLELRSERPLPDAGLVAKDLYVTFRADLEEGEEALLKRMERKRRQMMNYVSKAAYGYRVAGLEELPLFYDLFSQSMRHHGTPVYPRRFLAELLDRHPGTTNLFFIEHEGKTVAGVLNLLHRDVIMPFYAGADRSERPRGVDDYTYLAIMRWGRDHGYRTFDFGRSKRGTGAYDFKRRWGMEEVPLSYQYHLVKARELPNVSPANPKYKAAIRAWQKLPLPITRLLGPMIVKRVP